jgi:hypothetical protein
MKTTIDWIRVDSGERPEDGKKVLTYDGAVLSIAKYSIGDVGRFYDVIDEWFKEVTHWAHLPEPPDTIIQDIGELGWSLIETYGLEEEVYVVFRADCWDTKLREFCGPTKREALIRALDCFKR